MLQARRPRAGMTFLEVMVVVVILGILVTVAIPNMAGPRERTLLRQTARDVAAAGLLARQMAMAHGTPTYLYISPKTGVWELNLMPEIEDTRERRRLRDGGPMTADEVPRTLHHLVKFEKVKAEFDDIDKDERHILTFYPNGSSSGMAVMIQNSRGRSLTVDFDQLTARPEVYEGEPKTLAMKLKEHGIDPTAYGLEDPDALGGPARVAGEGFKRTAGMTSEERVDYYKSAVDRMIERSRNRFETEQAGSAAAYYGDAGRWGQ